MAEPVKPLIDLSWATNLIANGPLGGENRVEPPSAKKTDGWNYLEKPPREWFNYLMYGYYLWQQWAETAIDDIYSIINSGGLVPVGAMVDFAAASPPSGWLVCDGSAIARTGIYAALFAAIGTTWGAGNGTTTFNLPDFRGRSAVGSGSGSGLTPRTIAATGGEENHTLSTPEMPSHNHSDIAPALLASVAAGGDYTLAWVGGELASGTGYAGGGGGHNTMHPFAVAPKIIKY